MARGDAGQARSGWRLGALLPADAREYGGNRFVRWAAGVWLVVITVRSLIHLLSADGGAQSVATIDTSVPGGANIVALFGQWGAIQLLLVLLLWVLLIRYPGLTSLVLLILAAEPALRALAGALKPIETVGTAPGETLNLVVLPILALLFVLSLIRRR